MNQNDQTRTSQIQQFDYKKKKKRCNFIVRQNDQWKIYWDGLILIFALINSITIPLTLAFEEIRNDLDNITAYYIIDKTANVFFLADIVICMNTTYYDSDGEEVFSKSRIRKSYIVGMFPVDFLSSIPFELLSPWLVPSFFRVLNILKIIRIRRLKAIINKSNADEVTKSLYRSFRLLFILILVLHVIASLWYQICLEQQQWIPPLDFVYAAQYPNIYRVWTEDYSDIYRYIVFYYNAVLFLGGNEMGPRTELELLACTFILIALAIFNASLFGDVAVYTEMAGRK